MPSDIQIAQAATIKPISEIAQTLNLTPADWEPYGHYKAKLTESCIAGLKDKPDGALVLVSAMSPTRYGEGKTTVSTGLADAFALLGHKTVLALREPSLGPVFGVKGGAAGGGYSQVIPMEDINLHFTGDIHAVTAANNLLSTMIDNHLHSGNKLKIDTRKIAWRRCIDMNDRSLRRIVVGLVGNGVPREERFDITAASEIMAVLCLATDLADLKVRLARIVAAYDMDGKPVTAGQLGAAGAMAALLRDATRPNLVQTLAHTPALLHGGPFANIAHGCNSIRATKTALKMGDVVVTEAGFGADLGAEKFLDVKCRQGGIWPNAAVVVATIRALKHHGGADKDELTVENLDALRAGLPNLEAHVRNLMNVFGLPVAVALNRFSADTQAELDLVINAGKEWGAPVCLTEVWAKGGAGGVELAKALEPHLKVKRAAKYTYEDNVTLRDKINAIAKRIYGADKVAFEPGVLTSLKKLENLGYGNLPVIISKTQYSFSSDEKKLGRPTGFALKVTDCRVSAGAGFVVVYTGEVMTMPGLSPVPSAEAVDMDVNGVISGLF